MAGRIGALAMVAACAAVACDRAGGSDREPGELVLPVSRDTVVSAARGERDANLGGARRLKTKGIVELTLFDVPVEELRGRVVEAATLHLRSASDDFQRRVSVSTVSAEWVEGGSARYAAETGGASFDWAATGRRRWAYPASDVTAVINGRGGSRWSFADASPPGPDGWQTIAMDPLLVAARIAGASGGFALTDDVGHEWERRGEEFLYRVFPNRLFYSREAGVRSAPRVVVRLGAEDRLAPGPPRLLGGGEEEALGLGPGQELLRWATPADRGGAGTVGFEVRVAAGAEFDWERATAVPRYLVPRPGSPGEPVTLRLEDLPHPAGTEIAVGVRAVDGAGNPGPPAVARLRLAAAPPVPLPAAEPAAPPAARPLPVALGAAEVFVLDPLDKIHPVSGDTIPRRNPGYLRSNHLWSGSERRVRLAAARNEFVAFQVVVRGPGPSPRLSLRFDEPATAGTPRAEILRFAHVPGESGPLPDPLVPAGPGGKESEPEEGSLRAFLVDVYVPHAAAPGRRQGLLRIESGEAAVELSVELRIWDFTLPDHLSFVPQMNCYGLPPPPVDRLYYRLAHAHRTCLNRVPYNWRGGVREADRPAERRGSFDWRDWERRFAPLFDGSAFADLPRAGVPVDAFYLPLNENWPASIEEGYVGGYWADLALSTAYRRRFADGARGFAEHFVERGWSDTFFEFYLNNKVAYKQRGGWSRSSAPWNFDEPVNTQDFAALRWFGLAFHEAVAPALAAAGPRPPKMVFRADVSRPEWRRDLLDGVLDVHVVGGGFFPHLRPVLESKRQFGEIVYHYGGSNRVEESNVLPAAWCVRTWALGGDGVLPWQTVGKEGAWLRASPHALFYPGRGGRDEPVPSVRLKAYRRGQQDVEYLVLYAQATGRSRADVGRAALAALGLAAGPTAAGQEDPRDDRALDPVALWELRGRIGRELDRLAPPPRRRLVELRTPVRSLSASVGQPVAQVRTQPVGERQR